MLYEFEGAKKEIPYVQLSKETKDDLKLFLSSTKD